jgi:hypothetical protein
MSDDLHEAWVERYTPWVTAAKRRFVQSAVIIRLHDGTEISRPVTIQQVTCMNVVFEIIVNGRQPELLDTVYCGRLEGVWHSGMAMRTLIKELDAF